MKKKVKVKYTKEKMTCPCGGIIEVMSLKENNELKTDTVYYECNSCGVKDNLVFDDESRTRFGLIMTAIMMPTFLKYTKEFLEKLEKEKKSSKEFS